MSIVADHYQFIVGVNTRRNSYLRDRGVSLGQTSGAGNFSDYEPRGLERAAAWIGRRTEGDMKASSFQPSAQAPTERLWLSVLRRLAIAWLKHQLLQPSGCEAKVKLIILETNTAAQSTLVMDLEKLRDQRAGGALQTALKLLSVGRDQMNTDRLRSINALTALVRAQDLGLTPASH